MEPEHEEAMVSGELVPDWSDIEEDDDLEPDDADVDHDADNEGGE